MVNVKAIDANINNYCEKISFCSTLNLLELFRLRVPLKICLRKKLFYYFKFFEMVILANLQLATPFHSCQIFGKCAFEVIAQNTRYNLNLKNKKNLNLKMNEDKDQLLYPPSKPRNKIDEMHLDDKILRMMV